MVATRLVSFGSQNVFRRRSSRFAILRLFCQRFFMANFSIEKFELDETNTFISRCLAVNIAFPQKLRTRYGTPVMILLLPTDRILIRGSTNRAVINLP